MRIYYTAVDNGDGSLGVEFFESQECINRLEDTLPEYYRGEGGGYFDVFEIPIKMRLQTIEDVEQGIIMFEQLLNTFERKVHDLGALSEALMDPGGWDNESFDTALNTKEDLRLEVKKLRKELIALFNS